ncbi:MAG TPA: hypothetical protein VM901_03990 [Bdellovibrionota bacterium]|jgi:hypothetical protein|nr:hypothetical protein [Bdellovibrionota bacterium]
MFARLPHLVLLLAAVGARAEAPSSAPLKPRVSVRCLRFLQRIATRIEEMQNRLSYTELNRRTEERLKLNRLSLDSMGVITAKTYADVDVYPDTDGFKRNVEWEELIEHNVKRAYPSMIVTLPADTLLWVRQGSTWDSVQKLFPKGTTVRVLQSGDVYQYQPVDSGHILTFENSY